MGLFIFNPCFRSVFARNSIAEKKTNNSEFPIDDGKRKVFALQDDLSMTLQSTNFADVDKKYWSHLGLFSCIIENRKIARNLPIIRKQCRNFMREHTGKNRWENTMENTVEIFHLVEMWVLFFTLSKYYFFRIFQQPKKCSLATR